MIRTDLSSPGLFSSIFTDIDEDTQIDLTVSNLIHPSILHNVIGLSCESPAHNEVKEKIIDCLISEFNTNKERGAFLKSCLSDFESKNLQSPELNELARLLKPYYRFINNPIFRSLVKSTFPDVALKPSDKEKTLDPEHWKEISNSWLCASQACLGACGHDVVDALKGRPSSSKPLKSNSTHVGCTDESCTIDHSAQNETTPKNKQPNSRHKTTTEKFNLFKGKGLNVTLGLAFTGLVGALAYLIISGNKKNEQAEATITNVVELNLPVNSVKASSSKSHSLPSGKVVQFPQGALNGLTTTLQNSLKVA